ncbi:pyridoxamine 5'-phosphate oxidase family protein [Methanobrevibacter sp. DSM 116169]|uniref:pyridoxamine 5'-phosphate oxidase family protein n=1 Tax=Methanobrevibacter sp. DSM 116169 TaxID=3242727 RepID=UPI0038FC00AF
MRRKDKQIKDINEIINIIKKCDVCNLAFFDKEYPYIIPLNFGFKYDFKNKELFLYFHGSNIGKKIELINDNNKVAFEMYCSTKLIIKENPCKSTTEFESVAGNGIIEILNHNDKITGLKHIMNKYSDVNYTFLDFDESILKNTTVLKLKINSINGKSFKT